MLMRLMTATAISVALSFTAAPAALACGDDHNEAAKPVPADAKTVTFKVAGMSCDGCAMGIRNALLGLEGVFDATVSYQTGLAVVKYDAKLDEAKLSEVIVKAGYKVEKAAEAPSKT